MQSYLDGLEAIDLRRYRHHQRTRTAINRARAALREALDQLRRK